MAWGQRNTSDTDLTHQLAQRCASTTFADLPDDVIEIYRPTLLDWLGVTIAGPSRSPRIPGIPRRH
jgi:2-methylcitrate dehydratase PrpD